MRKLTLASVLAAAFMFTAAPANAHIIGLGWSFNGDGSITFDALHWHGTRGPTVPGVPISSNGALIFDGTFYDFTTVTNNTSSMTGLDGALTNPTYSTYDGAGTLSALSYDDWLHVTVPSVSEGTHTVDALGCGDVVGGSSWCLTDWTLVGDVTSFEIDAPPPTNAAVPEPASMVLLGSGLIGGAFVRRKKRA